MRLNPISKTSHLLTDYLKHELSQVEQMLIPSNYQEDLVRKVISHLMKGGGKRLRPAFVLAFNKIFQDNISDQAISVGSAVEYIHAATLLHDDVIDNSVTRRGAATIKSIWGNKISVLVGDFVLSNAFRLFVKSQNPEILKIISETSISITLGEIKQLIPDTSFKYDNYHEIITAKTASLFAAACEIGACLGEATMEHRKRAYNFGLNFGISFQIIDDILDYTGENIGKQLGNDLMNSRVTLPIIIAYENSKDEDKDFWHKVIKDPDFASLEEVVSQLKKQNAISLSLEKARSYMLKASLNLYDLPQCPLTEILSSFANFEILNNTFSEK